MVEGRRVEEEEILERAKSAVSWLELAAGGSRYLAALLKDRLPSTEFVKIRHAPHQFERDGQTHPAGHTAREARRTQVRTPNRLLFHPATTQIGPLR